uniref:Uncharacterized protein n=1 Tax=Rhizophagus irregularis (strain DAOM 181602 / DAOM 197198 / MUCL 43194) TaxID=747089 RepID=U9T1Q8_RHIID
MLESILPNNKQLSNGKWSFALVNLRNMEWFASSTAKDATPLLLFQNACGRNDLDGIFIF